MVESVLVPDGWAPDSDPMGLWSRSDRKTTRVEPSYHGRQLGGRDLDDVINTVIAEAGGDGPEGMTAVANVIKNRSTRRGLSAADVVRQPHQFEGYEAPGAGSRKAQQDPNIRA